MKRLLAPLFALGILLSACSPTADNGTGPIKIGFIGPLTGDANTYGSDTYNGAQMKVDEINEAGGINGRLIEFIVEDARCTGTDAASAAQKLINIDKVVAINGGQCSGETLAVAPIAESAKVPIISGGSTSPDVTTAGDFVFRNIPSDALAAGATASYLQENGLTAIALITENTDFAIGFRNSLIENMGEDSVVFNELVEPGTKDFRTLLTRLQDAEFDAFIANGQSVAVEAAMAMQFRELGLDHPIFSNNAVVSASLSEIAGEAVEGLKVVMPPSEGADANKFDTFAAEFTALHGPAASSMTYAANSYDIMGLLAKAIAEVGTDGIAIRDYLYGLDGYDGTVGRFSFDQNGDVVGIALELQEVQDGVFVKVSDIAVE
ncbi:MAG: ABC transporter substrate-binding protein [bacterium]|nr:ABC transporter substrate-binding protein [bacterium]MDA1292450.1 ABC transporter substrate-binding protein [bacterium]